MIKVAKTLLWISGILLGIAVTLFNINGVKRSMFEPPYKYLE